MIAGMQASTTSRVTTVIATPIVVSAVRFIDEKMALGTRDTMLTKMMSDMPLPMPRCVISSPIHMMNAVPATSVNTTRMSVRISGTSVENTTPYCGDLNSSREPMALIRPRPNVR